MRTPIEKPKRESAQSLRGLVNAAYNARRTAMVRAYDAQVSRMADALNREADRELACVKRATAKMLRSLPLPKGARLTPGAIRIDDVYTGVYTGVYYGEYSRELNFRNSPGHRALDLSRVPTIRKRVAELKRLHAQHCHRMEALRREYADVFSVQLLYSDRKGMQRRARQFCAKSHPHAN